MIGLLMNGTKVLLLDLLLWLTKFTGLLKLKTVLTKSVKEKLKPFLTITMKFLEELHIVLKLCKMLPLLKIIEEKLWSSLLWMSIVEMLS
jgi:hypothetical protein